MQILPAADLTIKRVYPTDPEFLEYLKARYEVFCVELNSVQGTINSDGISIETDIFDEYSAHFVVSVDNNIAAFVRVIMPDSRGLNVTNKYIYKIPDGIMPDRVGEISRMSLTKQFRKTKTVQQNIVQSLYKQIYLFCKEEDISHCVAAMDRIYTRLLNGMGFPFKEIGPVNDKTNRRVYLISAIEIEASVKLQDNSDFFFNCNLT